MQWHICDCVCKIANMYVHMYELKRFWQSCLDDSNYLFTKNNNSILHTHSIDSLQWILAASFQPWEFKDFTRPDSAECGMVKVETTFSSTTCCIYIGNDAPTREEKAYDITRPEPVQSANADCLNTWSSDKIPHLRYDRIPQRFTDWSQYLKE